MQIDPDLHDFIDQQQRDLPPVRDPLATGAQVQRYAALSRRLPSVLVPVTSGDFKLRPGGKPLAARMHWPTGAQAPVLMAWFVGGGWAAGDLDTHDGLCRQLAHDLGVAVACVQLPAAAGAALLQGSESALLALRTLAEGRVKLGVKARSAAGGWRRQRRPCGAAGRLAPGTGCSRAAWTRCWACTRWSSRTSTRPATSAARRRQCSRAPTPSAPGTPSCTASGTCGTSAPC
jgi:hypothetical protein